MSTRQSLILAIALFSASYGVTVVASGNSTKKVKPPAKTNPAEVQGLSEAMQQKLLTLTQKYGKEGVLSSNVHKKTVLKLLHKETLADGQILLKKGNMRLDLKGAEKSLVIVNEQAVWVVTYPPEDFKEAPVQVLQTQLKGKKKDKIGLAALLSGRGLFDTFKATGHKHEGDTNVFFLQPRKTSDDFKRAQVIADENFSTIREISYWDHLDNQTTYSFSDTKFGTSINDSQFKFKPDAKDQVTVLN